MVSCGQVTEGVAGSVLDGKDTFSFFSSPLWNMWRALSIMVLRSVFGKACSSSQSYPFRPGPGTRRRPKN